MCKALARWLHFTNSRGLIHNISFNPPLFIEVLVPSQEIELSCISVLGVLILPRSKIVLLNFGIFR